MNLLKIKQALRRGEYAWPGGYPLYFVTSDGAALSFEAVRQEWRQIVWSHLHNLTSSGWHIDGVYINWEDNNLYCDHTSQKIESAYDEDESD
jgi:hypothetical protein